MLSQPMGGSAIVKIKSGTRKGKYLIALLK